MEELYIVLYWITQQKKKWDLRDSGSHMESMWVIVYVILILLIILRSPPLQSLLVVYQRFSSFTRRTASGVRFVTWNNIQAGNSFHEHYANCTILHTLLEELKTAFENIPPLPYEMQPIDFIIKCLPRSEAGLSLELAKGLANTYPCPSWNRSTKSSDEDFDDNELDTEDIFDTSSNHNTQTCTYFI